MLQLQNLKASVNDKLILNGLNLEIKTGEVHCNYGPKWIWKKYISKYFIR